MNQIPTIREETEDDISGIREVICAAFGRPDEADLVDSLRRSDALTFSLVAVIGQRIVGHVAFSPITIGGQYQALALALAPVTVTPAFQKQGIGSALIRFSLEQCRQAGHEVIVVLGNPAYYHRFGFRTASEFGIECPFPVPPEVFMVLELAAGAAPGYQGVVRYHPAFELV